MIERLLAVVATDWLKIMLVLGGFSMLCMAWRMHEKNVFDFRDLIRENGHISLGKFAQFGAFCISTWVFIHLAVKDNLTEWYYSTYMLSWAGAGLATAWINKSRAEKLDAANIAAIQNQSQGMNNYGGYGNASYTPTVHTAPTPMGDQPYEPDPNRPRIDG